LELMLVMFPAVNPRFHIPASRRLTGANNPPPLAKDPNATDVLVGAPVPAETVVLDPSTSNLLVVLL
jgi:hypothetical protein